MSKWGSVASSGLFSSDGAIMKKVRGYLTLLREERPIPEELDVEKLVNFSMLPPALELKGKSS